MRRTSIALAAALTAAAACAAGASADHPEGTVTVSSTSAAGIDGTVARHGDPRAEFKPGIDEATPGAAPTSLQALPHTCPAVDRTIDDSHNSPHGPSAPVVKVIYAHPVGVGNRLSTYAPVIQAGGSSIADFVTSESGGALSIRFDIGTFEGPHCVDIQRVELPQSAAYYSSGGSFDKVANDVFARLGPQGSKRNFLIYADGVAPPGIAGEAVVYIGPGSDSPSGGLHGIGGLSAILYGRGGTDFFGSGVGFGAGQTSRTHLEVGLHEITHNLGAVQQSAPNSSGTNAAGGPALHCTDQYDLMCYADGGSNLPFVDSNCDGALSPPPDAYGPDFQAWDCNKDDYFAVNPPGGSYLSTHWNVANSIYICAFATCAPPDQQAPDVKISKKPRKRTAKRKVTIRFSVTERSEVTCKVDRRPAKQCESPFKTKVKRGRHKIEIGATDRVGLTDLTPAKAKFRRIKKK